MRRSRLKTYSHLSGARRIPSAYEVGSSRLAWHVERGLQIDVPFAAWFERYGRRSSFGLGDPEAFVDPRHTTYASYVELQARREAFVEGLFERLADKRGARPGDGNDADSFVRAIFSPLRYAGHGLQMLAAYLGQLAPAGRVTIACAFQAADELRRVQHLAYRLALAGVEPGSDDGRARWQSTPAFQPLRRVIEELLVTWDLGEAFAGLQLCLKPALDELVNRTLAARVAALGDPLFAEVLVAVDDDARWHAAWSAALVETAVKQRPENEAVLAAHVTRWRPRCAEAAAALAAAGDVTP
jgi:toluene monooxygenase system protein E